MLIIGHSRSFEDRKLSNVKGGVKNEAYHCKTSKNGMGVYAEKKMKVVCEKH